MSGLVTESKVRSRTYQRKFDHEEAQRLRADGWTYTQLAERYDVSVSAVVRICDPKTRARMNAQANAHNWASRQPCRGGCGALVWWMHVPSQHRSGYCPACYAQVRTAPDVRDNELRCTKCGEWKPDDAFGSEARKTRRGHRSWCRKCDSAARQANRRANLEREAATARKYKRKKATMAEYVVLLRDPADDARWVEVNRVDAASRMHAIEQAADKEGDYVAVTEAQITPFEVRQTMAFKVVSNGRGDPTKTGVASK